MFSKKKVKKVLVDVLAFILLATAMVLWSLWVHPAGSSSSGYIDYSNGSTTYEPPDDWSGWDELN